MDGQELQVQTSTGCYYRRPVVGGSIPLRPLRSWRLCVKIQPASEPIGTIPNQSEPFRTRSELGSRVPPHLGGQPIPAGKETVKFRSSPVKFRPVLTSVVKLGQGRKFFAGANGKETVKLFPRRRPPPPVHLQSPSLHLPVLSSGAANRPSNVARPAVSSNSR